MGAANLVDGQFGPQIILRPYAGFEQRYGGVSAATPLMFTEYVTGSASDALDPQAGTPGYSSRLMRGIPVPQGARVQIMLPGVLNFADQTYLWQIVWRMRNPGDAARQEGQLGWHFPKQANGTPDTRFAAPNSRYVIPAAFETILYAQTEPLGANTRASGNLRIETVSPRWDYLSLPILPDGNTGEYQQGVLDPGGSTGPSGACNPSYNSYFTNAKGDELLIGLYRDTSVDPTWNFAQNGADQMVAMLFGAGTPTDVGIYVSFGSSP